QAALQRAARHVTSDHGDSSLTHTYPCQRVVCGKAGAGSGERLPERAATGVAHRDTPVLARGRSPGFRAVRAGVEDACLEPRIAFPRRLRAQWPLDPLDLDYRCGGSAGFGAGRHASSILTGLPVSSPGYGSAIRPGEHLTRSEA